MLALDIFCVLFVAFLSAELAVNAQSNKKYFDCLDSNTHKPHPEPVENLYDKVIIF
jgi:hypothetical protein